MTDDLAVSGSGVADTAAMELLFLCHGYLEYCFAFTPTKQGLTRYMVLWPGRSDGTNPVIALTALNLYGNSAVGLIASVSRGNAHFFNSLSPKNSNDNVYLHRRFLLRGLAAISQKHSVGAGVSGLDGEFQTWGQSSPISAAIQMLLRRSVELRFLCQANGSFVWNSAMILWPCCG